MVGCADTDPHTALHAKPPLVKNKYLTHLLHGEGVIQQRNGSCSNVSELPGQRSPVLLEHCTHSMESDR